MFSFPVLQKTSENYFTGKNSGLQERLYESSIQRKSFKKYKVLLLLSDSLLPFFCVCVCPQMSPKRHFVVSFATIASVLCRGGWRYLHLSIFDYLIELNVSKSIALNLSLQGEPELTPLCPFFPPDCLSHPRKIESMSIGIPSIVSRSVLCKKSSISYDLS